MLSRTLAALCLAVGSAEWRETAPEEASAGDASQNIFMCVTGQSARLEIRTKIKNFVKPCFEKGHNVDVVAILDHRDDPYYVNKPLNATQSRLLDLSMSSIKEFEPYTRHVRDVHFSQPENPTVPTKYAEYLGQDHKPRISTSDRAIQHVRQFTSIQKCYDEMRDLEFQNGKRYDQILRIRDDAYILAPIALLNERNYTTDFVTQKCDSWSGLNDKAALMTRGAADVYFPGFLKELYLNGPRDTWVENPETLTKSFLSHANLTLTQGGGDIAVTSMRGNYADETACLHMRTIDCFTDVLKGLNILEKLDVPWCQSDIELGYGKK